MASADAHLSLLSLPHALPTTTTNKAARQQEEEEGSEKAMSGAGTVSRPVVDTAPAQTTAACYFCGDTPAVVFCRADAAGLCLPCDRHVHGANTVCSRHARAPLCAACRAAGASVRRAGGRVNVRFLCSDCDFDENRRGAAQVGDPPLHDRGTVEGYTGCPSVGELAALLGVVHGCGDEKAAADEGWWPVWEEPQVLTFDEVIVPTTSCHGLQPLLTSSSPKKRSPPCGELEGEVLRQLGELAKSEAAAAYVEAEPARDLPTPWASSEYDFGHSHFEALGTEAVSEETSSIDVPYQNHEAWSADDRSRRSDVPRDMREQVPASSPAEPSLSSFVEIAEVCPTLSRTSSSSIDVANGDHDHPPAPVVAAMPAPAPEAEAAQRKVGGYDVAYPDRSLVISRYKEKRKNRIFGKQVRYESRKARADGRVRIRGRFAKSSEV